MKRRALRRHTLLGQFLEDFIRMNPAVMNKLEIQRLRRDWAVNIPEIDGVKFVMLNGGPSVLVSDEFRARHVRANLPRYAAQYHQTISVARFRMPGLGHRSRRAFMRRCFPAGWTKQKAFDAAMGSKPDQAIFRVRAKPAEWA